MKFSPKDALLSLMSSSSSLFKWLHLLLTRIFKFPKRNELPATLFQWKHLAWSENHQEVTKLYIKYWGSLEPFFAQHQFALFPRSDALNQWVDDFPSPSNYVYYPVNGCLREINILRYFGVLSTVQHAAIKNKRHYVIRVMRVGKQGQNHLQIMRLLSNTVPDNLYSNYHIMPMLEEIEYKDITFGVFPFTYGKFKYVFNQVLSKCTLEDALHLIMQALEAIKYTHGKNIAHRDLYLDNFLIDFIPNSLQGQQWTRPRIYLTDFESAVHVPDDVDPSERLVSGFPFDVEDFGLEIYNRRPPAPELLRSSEEKYCPFRLDMFQFGADLAEYLKTTGFDELDALWPPLMSYNPANRPTASELFDDLAKFINQTRPADLQRGWTYVAPTTLYSDEFDDDEFDDNEIDEY